MPSSAPGSPLFSLGANLKLVWFFQELSRWVFFSSSSLINHSLIVRNGFGFLEAVWSLPFSPALVTFGAGGGWGQWAELAKSQPEAVGWGSVPSRAPVGTRSICEMQRMGEVETVYALIEKTACSRQTDGSRHGPGCYGSKAKPQNKKRNLQLGLVHF